MLCLPLQWEGRTSQASGMDPCHLAQWVPQHGGSPHRSLHMREVISDISVPAARGAAAESQALLSPAVTLQPGGSCDLSHAEHSGPHSCVFSAVFCQPIEMQWR